MFRRIFLLIMSIVSLAACGPTDDFVPENPIVYGLTLRPSGFDPHIHASSESGIVLRQVYDTLVYRDPGTREIVPGLATNWTISDDRLQYTFTLRDGVTFHDGTPFNAQAVAANLDRITDPATGSQRARFMLGPYQRHEVIDNNTIRIILAEPFAPLLDSFSQVYLGIASPDALAEYSNARYQFHQVGTGPYRMIEFTPGDSLVIRRNLDYTWGPSFYEPSAENPVDQITYRFFTDSATRGTALESGAAQIMGELPAPRASVLNNSGTVQLLPTDIPGMPLQFMFNTAQAPTDNQLVRQALIHATNRAIIVDTVFRGFVPVAWGPLTRETLYYTRDVEGRYPYDVDQARRLLSAAGFTDTDDDGLIDDGTEPLTLSMIVPPWGSMPAIAQLIQDQWREIGLTLELEQVSGFTALREAIANEPYHLVSFETAGYDPYLLNAFYATDGANNYMNYSNPELDATLINAAQELAPNNRRILYGQIQQFIMDQALILPIGDRVNLNAVALSVENLQFDPYGWFPLLYAITHDS